MGARVKQKERSMSVKKILAVVAMLILFIALFIIFTDGRDYNVFATCLHEQGVVMAGTEWCSHCKEQKSKFNGAFEDILIPNGAYVDCEADPDWCDEKGVAGYPTWVLADDITVAGVQDLSTLSKLTGCPLE